MILKILSPSSPAREISGVEAIFLPGSESPFEILPSHAPIVSALDAGELRWRVSSQEESLKIKGGAVRFDGLVATVCAEI